MGVSSVPRPVYTFLVTSNETVVANFVNAVETLATDNTTDPVYSSGWSDGSNGGIGFDPWVLTKTSTDGNRDGFFLDLSTDNAPHVSPGIDTNGKIVGHLREHHQHRGGVSDVHPRPGANRGATPDRHGQRYNDTVGSAVGFTLRDGNATNSPADYTTGARLQFYLAGGDANYTVVDAAGAHDSGVPLTYTACI